MSNPHGREGISSSHEGKSSNNSKFKGIIIPHPVTTVQPIDIVNRYQVLGQIPKPYNSVLASKPPVIYPFANTSKTLVTTNKPSIPFDLFDKTSDYVQRFEYNLFYIESFMKPSNDPVKLAAQYFPSG